VIKKKPEGRAKTLLEDLPAQPEIHLVEMFSGQPAGQPGRDDRAGGRASRQAKYIMERLVEFFFQHAECFCNNHSSNPTSVNGNSYVPAEWFHLILLLT